MPDEELNQAESCSNAPPDEDVSAAAAAAAHDNKVAGPTDPAIQKEARGADSSSNAVETKDTTEQHAVQQDEPRDSKDDNVEHTRSTSQETADNNVSVVRHREEGSAANEYLVKTIDWIDRKTGEPQKVRIITQNENGPCPMVAICNVLFLRGDLEIRPPDRPSVTFEYLVERLGDYLLNHGPPNSYPALTELSSSPTSLPNNDTEAPAMKRLGSRQSTNDYVLTYRHNLDAALSILPRLQSGLDVNVRFSSIRDFEPTAELAMFDLFNVDLVHGWIADPQDEQTFRVVVEQCGSYNSLVECVVKGDTLSSGAIVEDTNGNHTINNGGQKKWTPEEESQIRDGLIAADFLQDTATQLTYYGLELLMEIIPADQPCVLFRNNHFSTLYKDSGTQKLYTLVTDYGYVRETSIVWESLSDIDQGLSEFYDGLFRKPEIHPESQRTSRAYTSGGEEGHHIDGRVSTADLDYALALSLQQQEEELSAAERRRREQQEAERRSTHQHLHYQQTDSSSPSTERHRPSAILKKKKSSCVVM